MTDKISKTLKKITAGILKTSKNYAGKTNNKLDEEWVGDPDCPHCRGAGYLRVNVPIRHPDFGKLQICSCRQSAVQQQVRDRLFALSNLTELQNLTFETFRARGRIGLGPSQADSIERAHNQAQMFAQNQQGWLLLQGKYGCGKTHLAAAIANYAVEIGVPALFITVPDLLDTLRYAYNDPGFTFEQRFEEIRRAPLLILDDFGTQNATEWAQEKLFQILNFRYINRLPLVITTNLTIDQIEGRIRSRLQDPELVTHAQILAPDYRRPGDDTGHHEISSLIHLNRLTFGSFNLRAHEQILDEDLRTLKDAFRVANSYAKSPEGWLVFTGRSGTGKTHLAAAIANYRAGLGSPPLFIMVPDLLDHLRATFAPESQTRFDRLFQDIRSTPLLVLDDLGPQSMTPWAREKLYQLFNHRYIANLATVITTANKISELDERITNRVLDERICQVCAIQVPPYRGTARR
ncbi:MAG: ATP-binding protein [Anaerolineales bacterium]